jgi:protein-S-isoprenylcysteine O-methyltransferase Ste14
MSRLETKVPPPVFAVLAVLVALGVNWWLPQFRIVTGPIFWVGVGLLIAGIALVVAAVLQFMKVKTTIDPLDPSRTSALVTGGVFRLTRNPMYLAMLLEVLGLVLILGNPVSLIGPVLFVFAVTVLQIRPEERALGAKFGPTYVDYCAQVRRWI